MSVCVGGLCSSRCVGHVLHEPLCATTWHRLGHTPVSSKPHAHTLQRLFGRARCMRNTPLPLLVWWARAIRGMGCGPQGGWL